MAKKTGPYVGVTGFMSRVEVKEAFKIIPQESQRRLMVGVLMSSKTLAGQQNKWSSRYPKKEAVADIFVDDPRALNLVHYSTDHPETLCSQLREITELASSRIDGFQLNIAWPPVSEIEYYNEANPEKFLVLQIGSGAMAQVESMERFTELVGAYLPMIDAILIDMSGGRGEYLDAVKGSEYFRALHDYSALGLGIAGGLGPDTLHALDPLIREFPDLSVDAEGRLRIWDPEGGILSLGSMRVYLEDAFPILAGVKLPGTQFAKGTSYGFEEFVRRYGSGHNMLRTTRVVQPRALRVGDILATGDRVLSLPREGGNGSVLIHLTGGVNGHWIGVPARIPVALLTEEDNAPKAVWKHGEE